MGNSAAIALYVVFMAVAVVAVDLLFFLFSVTAELLSVEP
jgi:hypothetical protein